jgi:hypothetical protein
MDLPPEQILERARRHVFLCGVDDTAEHLCGLNMSFGLAKIHHFQMSRGMDPDCVFIGAPDATVTRNENRWVQGIGYGGKLVWSGGFSILDVKPNGCGVVMGRLDRPHSKQEVEKRWREASAEPLIVEGERVEWDVFKGNHFIEVLEPDERAWDIGWSGPVFLLHSSGREFRSESDHGPGLYWDASAALAELWHEHHTPWGVLRVLTGEDAARYDAHCRWVHRFQMDRREALARRLFGDFELIFNGTHQGVVRQGSVVLGCYTFGQGIEDHILRHSGSTPLFPLTLRPELPVYLLRGIANLTEPFTEKLGWEERARELGVSQPIRNANILPHGGGTAYPDLRGKIRVVEKGGRRVYESSTGDTTARFETLRDMEFIYRGTEVLSRTLASGLGEVAGKLNIKWWLGGGR